MMQALPLARLLVPAFPDAAPAGFTVAAGDITNGLPHRVELSPGLILKLAVPTGVARQWLDLEPGSIVSTSADQAGEYGLGQASLPGRQTPRLCAIRDGRIIGRTPLTLGRRVRFASNGASVQIELIMLGWS